MHDSSSETPNPDGAPDFGARNSELIVRRAVGWRLERLAGEYGTNETALKAFFDRHGWPPAIVGKPALAAAERPRPAPIPPAPRHGGFLDRSQPPED